MKVGNDALAHQFSIFDHMQDLVVLPVDQGQLESIFGSVDVHGAGFAFSVQHKKKLVKSLNSQKIEKFREIAGEIT